MGHTTYKHTSKARLSLLYWITPKKLPAIVDVNCEISFGSSLNGSHKLKMKKNTKCKNNF